jgi:hypothetical protein
MRWTVLALALVAGSGLALGGCNKLGTKNTRDSCEVYVQKPVSKGKGNELMDFLEKQKFCEGNRKSFQLRKNDETYELRIVVKAGKDKEAEFVQSMKELGRAVRTEVFSGDQLSVHLCDEEFKTLKVLDVETAATATATAAPVAPGTQPMTLQIPDSDLVLDKPAGWQQKRAGDWGVLVPPDDKAILAFVVYTRPNESTARLGQVASVLNTGNIRWQAPKAGTVGAGNFPATIAEGSCTFPSGPGGMAYATVDAGAKKILVVYALQKDASEQTRQQAAGIMRTLRRR